MRAFINDLVGTDTLAIVRYREALALDEQGWCCLTCDAPLPPFTLCAAVRCIALRADARVRRMAS